MEMRLPTQNQASVLKALGSGQQRYTDIEAGSKLEATQVSRALKVLVKEHLVLAQTVGDGQYPVKVRYSLSKRGAVVLEALMAYEKTLRKASAEKNVRVRDLPHLVG